MADDTPPEPEKVRLTVDPSQAVLVIKNGVKHGRDSDVFRQAMRIFNNERT